MIRVAVFVNFRFDTVHEYATAAEAKAFVHGVQHGWRLSNASGPMYVATLPGNNDEMVDIIPAAEIARLREALGTGGAA